MKYHIDKKEQYAIFKLDEEKVNSIIAPEFKSELVVLNAEGIRNIILDLSSVRFVDSSGLSAILVGNRLCKSVNGTLAIAGLQENVMKLIKISQLDSVLNIIPTVEEAKDFVIMEELERDMQGGKDE